MTKLFTDTSANLPLSLLTAHHIEVLPFSYTVDGKPVPYSETTDFDGKAFYDAMRAGAAVKTSMINTETFREHFTRALEAGDAEVAASFQADVEPIRDVLHMGSTPQTLKRALELAGVPVGPARRPVAETTPEVDDKVRAMLDHYGIAHE